MSTTWEKVGVGETAYPVVLHGQLLSASLGWEYTVD